MKTITRLLALAIVLATIIAAVLVADLAGTLNFSLTSHGAAPSDALAPAASADFLVLLEDSGWEVSMRSDSTGVRIIAARNGELLQGASQRSLNDAIGALLADALQQSGVIDTAPIRPRKR